MTCFKVAQCFTGWRSVQPELGTLELMSLSKEDRLKDMGRALTLMLQELGDKAFDTVIFQMDAAPFEGIYSTTWRELEALGLIEKMDVIGGSLCKFTGNGWRAAIDLVWSANEPMLREAMSKVAAALKDHVKGRQEDAFVYLNSIATISGVPENLVFNIIESRLLDYRFNMMGAYWYQGRPPLIHIPLDFGLEPL